jgi:hypothetical protein
MLRRHLVGGLAIVLATPSHVLASAVGKPIDAPALASAPRYRFGILDGDDAAGYRLWAEATRVPRRYKASGFRFGVEIDNPGGATLEWYELIRFPTESRQATGNLKRDEARVLRADTQTSSDTLIVDDFWFDEGDPLGLHRLDLVVNGVPVWGVDFVVVAG